jgi:DnaJ domain
MASPLTPFEYQTAYKALGVTESELQAIEAAPYLEGEALLKKLKERIRKTYRYLAKELHPDVNGGDAEKTALFNIVTRVSKELAKRTPKPPPPGMAPSIPNGVVRAKSMRANVRKITKPLAGSSAARDIASRLAKMRP